MFCWSQHQAKKVVKKVFTRLKPAPPLTSVQSQPVHYQERINNSLHDRLHYSICYEQGIIFWILWGWKFCKTFPKTRKFPKKNMPWCKSSPPRKINHLAMTSKNAQHKVKLYFHFTLHFGKLCHWNIQWDQSYNIQFISGNKQKTPSYLCTVCRQQKLHLSSDCRVVTCYTFFNGGFLHSNKNGAGTES